LETFSQFKWTIIKRKTEKGKYSRALANRKQEIIDILSYIYCGFSEDKIGFNRKFEKLRKLLEPKQVKFRGKGYEINRK
jgi:hypothetical protein